MTVYVVKRGDTLWSIARQFGVSVNTIVEANGIEDLPHLVIGQALVIPGKQEHTSSGRDSLWSIARRFGVTAERLAEYNRISTLP